MNRSEIIASARELIPTIIDPEVLAIYIGGGIARGELMPFSDCDIYIIAQKLKYQGGYSKEYKGIVFDLVYLTPQAIEQLIIQKDGGTIDCLRHAIILYDPHGIATSYQKTAQKFQMLTAEAQLQARQLLAFRLRNYVRAIRGYIAMGDLQSALYLVRHAFDTILIHKRLMRNDPLANQHKTTKRA